MRTLCLFIAGALLALWVFPLCSRVKNPQKTDQFPDVSPPVVHVLTAFTDTVYLDTLSFTGTAFDSSGLKFVISYARSDTDTAVISDSTWKINALSLSPGKDSVHLRFTDSLGNSADTLLAVLYYEVTPAAPTNLALDVYDRQFVRVRWKDNAQTEEGFNIWRSVDGLDWVFAGEAEADKISYIDTTRLSSDTIYYYTVNAFNAAGISGKIPHRGITLTRLISVDSIPPSIRFVSPHHGDSLGTDSVLVLLSVVDSNGVSSVRINDSIANILGNYWVRKEPLATGQNWFVARATDRSGNTSRDSIAVYYGADVPDRNGPLITFISPRQNDTVSAANLMLSGTAIDPSGIGSVTVDDSSAALLNELNWRMPLVLHNGTNRIRVSVTDRLRNPTDTVLILVLDTNHVDNVSPVLQVLSPQPFDTVRTDTVTFMGAVFDPSGVCSVLVNSVPASLEMLSWRATIPLTKGWDTITIEAVDSSALRNRTVQRLYVLRNNAPLFLETGIPRDTLLYRGDIYRASLSAMDPNDDPISFALVRPPSPDAAILNAQDGRLEWTPANKGEYRMLAYVWDGDEADTAKWTVMVGANAPSFVPSQLAMLPTTDTVGHQYTASLQAYDRDGLEGLVFKLLQAPSYVNLDSTSGQISWDVVFEDTGAHAFSAVVRDPEGLSDTVSWQVHIVLGEIRSPQFTTASRSIPTSDTVGQIYRVDLNGTDALPLTLSYSLALKPAGMQIDSSGVITWTPVAADTGAREVKAIVRNSQNREDTLSWTVTVYKNRLAPIFGAGAAVDTVLVGHVYAKLLAASHPYGEAVTYFFLQRPSPNIDLNSSTGLVSWVPDISYRDSVHALAAICTTVSGLSDTLRWQIFTPERSPKMLTTAASLPTADTVGQMYSATLQARDPYPGPLVFRLASSPAGMTIDSATGLIRWTPDSSQIRAHDMKAQVVNLIYGRTDSLSWTVSVYKNNLAPLFPAGGFVDTVLANSSHVRVIFASHPYKGRPYMEPLVYVIRSAPAGLVLNGLTGLLQWTPAATDTGLHAVSLLCTTAAGLNDTLDFSIFVPKRSPRFMTLAASLPQSDSVGGTPYIANILAADDIPGDLTYALLSPVPNGITLTQTSRTTVQVTWPADSSNLGQHAIGMIVSNPAGRSDTLSWTVMIYKDRKPPVFGATPLADTVIVDSSYAKQLSATHPYNDSVFFKLTQKPSPSTTIDASTGLVSWVPGTADKGVVHTITAVCSVQVGTSDTMTWTLFVADRSPHFTTSAGSLPTSDTAYGSAYAVNLVAADDIPGDLTYSLVAPSPSGMTIGQVNRTTAQISWSADSSHISSSPHTIKTVVANTHGRSDTISWSVTIYKNNTPPVFPSGGFVDTVLADSAYSRTITADHPYKGRPYMEPLVYVKRLGPAGLSLSPSTGSVAWSPVLADTGLQNISAVCTTAAGIRDTLEWQVLVLKRSPYFVTLPSALASSDTAYGANYTANLVAADDIPGDLSYSLVAPPSGMSIAELSRTTAQITWVSDSSHISGTPRTIKAVVSNLAGRSDTITWSVTIYRDNRMPVFTTTDLADTNNAGSAYSKTITATHAYAGRPYRDTLTFTLLDDTLSGNVITNLTDTTARIDWTPQWPHIRTNTIAVRVSTVAGLSDTLTWTVNVPNRAPVIGAVDTSSIYFRNHTWRGVTNSWTVVASDSDGEPLVFKVLSPSAGDSLPIFQDSATGTLTWNLGPSDSLGYRIIRTQVRDLHGGADTVGWQILCGDTALWNRGMKPIPAGSFLMGDTVIAANKKDYLNYAASSYAGYRDTLVHQVTITRPYLMDSTEVPYRLFVEYKPTHSQGLYEPAVSDSNHAARNLTWEEAVLYCNWKSKRVGLDTCYTLSGQYVCDFSKNGYRLPTETEWERAARGGVEGERFYWGNDTTSATVYNFANVGGTGGRDTTHLPTTGTIAPVAWFAANGYGLHDLNGDVQEWCYDWYSAYSTSTPADWSGPATGDKKVIRDGFYNYYSNSPAGSWKYLRLSTRHLNAPDYRPLGVGFRVVRNQANTP